MTVEALQLIGTRLDGAALAVSVVSRKWAVLHKALGERSPTRH
jgi:hypothetical protein